MSAPWMPLYVADYLADTAHLSAAESGAYLHLIMNYWRHGKLPADDLSLARIARMSAKEWARAKETIQAFFHDGWEHKRIDFELEKSARKSEARSEFGTRGGNAKSLNSKKEAVAKATILPDVCQPFATPFALASSSQPQPDIEITKVISNARGTRIAEGWTPSSQDWDIAIAEIGGLLADRELAKFRDYWIGKPGAGGRKSDWGSTWRNWVRKASDDQKARAGPRTARPSLDDAFATIDAMQNRGSHERAYHSGPTISLAAIPFARGTG